MLALLNDSAASALEWSRLQFALTACYHWLFVPLTLGLAVVMGLMETAWYRTNDAFWKHAAQFWQKIFGINFAIGVATGIILEFEFGTNWSNYSWFVGDIFGAPLAIEGIVAFFMEATFIAVMFFGWNKVGRGTHLASTWLTGLGATLSAWWILVANSWMQHPVGTTFNPETVRNEMTDFFAVAFAPEAVTKFCHTVTSGWMTGGVFAVGVGCWFLLRGRNRRLALASVKVGSIVGIVAALLVMATGDKSGIDIARTQPMKLAAAEGLERGGQQAPFSIVPGIEVPGVLSILATHDLNGYVPGSQDIIDGYTDNRGVSHLPVAEMMERGRKARVALGNYHLAVKAGDEKAKSEAAAVLKTEREYLGYGYLNSPEDLVPPTGLVYWSFRAMVGCGSLLLLVLALVAWFGRKGTLENKRWLLQAGLWSLPLVYIAGQAGWIVAEVGRQPWAIQDLLPVTAATSTLSAGAVQTTFFLFLILFTVMLVAEVRIMLRAIRQQPDFTH